MDFCTSVIIEFLRMIDCTTDNGLIDELDSSLLCSLNHCSYLFGSWYVAYFDLYLSDLLLMIVCHYMYYTTALACMGIVSPQLMLPA